MTPADLQRIRASAGWRAHRIEVLHDTSVGSVLVKGQRPPRPAWRHQLLSGFARLAGMPLLRAAPAHGGARAQRIEVQRLRQLAAAGVPVPQVLHVEADFFVQRWLGEQRLDALLQQPQAMLWWQRGLQALVALVALHARGQYLSQAFARNFIASGDMLAMIDFEDDPLEVMPLHQAQARDWLAYLHSSARVLRTHSAAQQAAAIEALRAELSREAAPVRALVAGTARRLRWAQRLQAGDGSGWRRHVAILQSAVALMLAADSPEHNPRKDDKVTHARHH
jgi:tRNA A-37 threonylcarbamoyl transferase component Bud32